MSELVIYVMSELVFLRRKHIVAMKFIITECLNICVTITPPTLSVHKKL